MNWNAAWWQTQYDFAQKKGMLNFSGLFPDMYPKVFSVLWIGGEKYLCQFEPNDWNVFLM